MSTVAKTPTHVLTTAGADVPIGVLFGGGCSLKEHH